MSAPLRVGDVLHETWRLYRSFFVRSATATLVVFGGLGIVAVQGTHSRNDGMLWLMFLLPLAGTALVQGMLVEAVEDERSSRVTKVFGSGPRRLGALLVLSLLTGLGVGLGLLLLCIPGLVLFVRWSLSVPALVIEGLAPRAAMRRSRELVSGRFWSVLRLLLAVGVQTALVAIALRFGFSSLLGGSHDRLVAWFTGTLAAALATPYTAHALTVAYYRLTASERPRDASPRPGTAWASVWDQP